MSGFEEYEKQLKNSPQGSRIMELANSGEGQRLSKMLDGKQIEKAAKSGDMDTLKSILTQVLSTPEGKSLAKKLQDGMK